MPVLYRHHHHSSRWSSAANRDDLLFAKPLKLPRTAGLEALPSCNMQMAWLSRLQNHEISEAVALQRFAEYKTKMFQAIRHDEAIVAAGEAAGAGAAAASGPKTCITTGGVVNCF
jgi:hypothetical protein